MCFIKILALVLLVTACSSLNDSPDRDQILSCRRDKALHASRSKELQRIVDHDQQDRKGMFSKNDKETFALIQRDIERRKRVAEIFAEGCLLSAGDFAAAALVFQHGDVPEHYLQAFMWSKRAVELGDKKQNRLMGLALDRYLVSRGHKQLFASQASKMNAQSPDSCWCLQPIEPSFPDRRRKAVVGKSKTEAFQWLAELNKGTSCENRECPTQLKASLKGTVPGYW